MYKLLPNQTLNFRALLSMVALIFSFQAYAVEDTNCGSISGFEFSNGTETVTINNDQSYYIEDLPNNFYVDLMVNGYSQSAKFYVTNINTGQCYNVNENHLPYTFPGGNGAWNFGCGDFRLKAKLYKYDGCSYVCDTETINFSITCSPPCGDISGFEFSNGDEVVSIANNGEYNIDTLPNNFYIDLLVDGQSESSSLRLENLNTGQVYNVGENHLPYTIPGGNSAWSYGTGDFKLKAKIFEFNYCQGDSCDEQTIYFTINDAVVCGQIDGLEFSNFSSDPTVAIVDGGSYDFNNIPTDFNINVLTSGNIESAFNTLTNVDTGEIYTKLENVVPYTFPGATTQVWTLGCGTFNFCASVYQDDHANGPECDSICVTFTITNCEVDCGTLDEFAFSNGTENLSIVEGGVYNFSDLPLNAYVDAIVAGPSESVRLTVTNSDTNESFVIVENVIPYTYPAGGAEWNLGLGNFQVQAEIFSGDNCNATLCDVQTRNFTLVDIPLCDDTIFAGTGTLDASAVLVTPGIDLFVTITPNGDAVIPTDYALGTVVTGGSGLVIQEVSNTTTIRMPQVGGAYKVHMLAYDPTSLNLDDITLGSTTAFDVLDLIDNGQICADLDAVGSPILVILTGSTDRAVTEKEETKADVLIQAEEISSKTEEAGLITDVRLYPNPVVNQLNVDITLFEGEVLNYIMLDLNGKQILSGNLTNNTNVISTEELAAGLYILKLNSEGRSFTKKILVNK